MDIWDTPELRELEFHGLLIREGWDPHSQHTVVALITTSLFLLVVWARLVFGDWSTAWTAGAFFVALIALLIQWLRYFVS
jgi:hypothetical protein